MVTGKGLGREVAHWQEYEDESRGSYMLLFPSFHSPSEAPVGPLGQVKLTVWYHSDEQKLISIIHSCR